MNKCGIVACCTFAVLFFVHFAPGENPANQQKVPVIDGGVGPCSLELTVNGSDQKPVYNATVKVHISYGFAGARRLDLQAGTGSDGKVKFSGLPSRVHHPPLEFQATKDDLQGSVEFDPILECHGQREIALQKAKPETP